MKQITRFIFSFIFLWSFNNIHAVFNKTDQFVIINHNTPIYSNFADNKHIDNIDLGISFYPMSQKGMRIQFLYLGQEVWVDQKNVGIISFNAKNFVDKGVLFNELPIVSENEVWFAYKNNFYNIDLRDKYQPKIQLKAALPNFSDISATENRSLLALTGDVFSNNTSILNVALYNTKQRIFSPLTYFYGDSVSMNSLEFSQDNQLIALYYSIDNNKILHIYRVATKELILSVDNVLSYNWIDSTLLIYTSEKILMYKTKDSLLGKEMILYRFNNKMSAAPLMVKLVNQYLFQIKNIIYLFQNDELVKTEFKSIERSPNGDLEYYTYKEQSCATYKGKRIRSLSGKNPQWTYMSILDDSNIIYKHQNGAIYSIYMYNINTEKSLPYYWIEEPFYIFKDGVGVEFVRENDSIYLFLEKPKEWVKNLPIHQLLK